MDLLQAVILGIVQGITEFLPISSSGHLVVLQRWLGIEQHNLAFDLAAHLGTLLSVLTVYHRLVRRLTLEVFRWPFQRKITPEIQLIGLVFIASLPTALMGFFFKDFYTGLFSSLRAVGFLFILTGGLLLLTRGRGGDDARLELDNLQGLSLITWKKALLIGVAQGVSIAPGISRSGATIATALLAGLPKNTAAMFSFMMAIPAILGASFLELKDVDWSESTVSALVVGFLVSYISALIGLKLILHVVRKGRLELFTGYLWVLGILVVVWSF